MTDHANNLLTTDNPVERLARAHEVEALSAIVAIMRDTGVKPEIRLKAADSVLERARGKSKNATPPPPVKDKQKPMQLTTKQLMEIVAAAQKSGVLAATARPVGGVTIEATPTKKAVKRIPRNEWANDLDANESAT